jgi:hypothetical protein
VALLAGVLSITGALGVTLYVDYETGQSERAALTSEAGYMCHAMSWQVFYLAGDNNPQMWDQAQPKRGNLDLDHPSRAWSKPSWFPFRAPVWSSLKDRIGALKPSEARVLTDFFNRAEFLDVLRLRRHCFQAADPGFFTIYMCAISAELKICADQQYGWELYHDSKSTDRNKRIRVDYYEQFGAISKQLDDGLCNKTWPTDLKPQAECDSDIWPTKGRN